MPWLTAGYFFNAANVAEVKIGDDLTSLCLEIVYCCSYSNGKHYEATFVISCEEMSYINLRRGYDHEPGCGVILEAHLTDKSPLIEDFYACRLGSVVGALFRQDDRQGHPMKHLQLVGDINIDVLSEEVLCYHCEGELPPIPEGLDAPWMR